MTITRVSLVRRPFLPLKFAQIVMLKRLRIVGRERRRRWLRNVSDDRYVVRMTRGIASAGAGGEVRSAWSAPMPGGRDMMRKVYLGDADTALALLRTMRRRGRRAVDGRDVLRDQGARAPMERASGVLVVQPPSGIGHIHLMMRGTFYGGIDDEDIVLEAAVQTVPLLMWIIARGIHDVLVTMIVPADIGVDTDRARALLTRRLAPKRCQRIWVPGIDPLAQDPPVSLR